MMQYLLALTLLLAPTYVVRFSLFGRPTNLLMVWIFLLWVIFILWIVFGKRLPSLFHWLRTELKLPQAILALAFLLAGVISLFVGGISEEKLGQFIVLFIQPIGTFFITWYVWSSSNQGLMLRGLLIRAVLIFIAVSGLYAIIQYFTLLGVPVAWWGNAQEPKRAVAFFLHPNFYALFITPLLAFVLPVVNDQWLAIRKELRSELLTTHYSLLTTVAWLLGAIGLLLSLSRGGWLGLAVAVGLYILVAGNRKIIKSALVAGALVILIVVAVPNFRYRVLLPFRGEKSIVARFSLWNTGWKMVKDNPVLGKGLLGFSNNWDKYNTDPGLQHYPGPHNIFLNFWVDTGLLGLISFFGLIALALKRSWQKRKTSLALGLTLACVALVVHGLVDIPYFKNDLALVFWLLYAFV